MTDLATCPDPFYLDPRATDVLGEGERLRARGKLVPAVLEGGVRAWATGHRDVAEEVLGGRSFRKHPDHWADLKNGEIPPDWGILEFITLPGMLNEDGARHRDLRSLVSQAFTPRRVENLRPRIEQITQDLITGLAGASSDGFVDLRSQYAFELPMQIICALFGLDTAKKERLAHDYAAIHDSSSTPEDVVAGKAGVAAVITELIASKRDHEDDDLTSALVRVTDSEQSVLDDGLLLSTLMLFLFAGHETTTNLIANTIRALSDHPEQLKLIRAGDASVDELVEETLRFNGPVNTVMFRYAAEDVRIAGTEVTVRAGDAVVVCLAATGRDTGAFGPHADTFSPARSPLAAHLAFGHGVHYCIGAPLARLMARTAVGTFLQHFDWDLSGAPAPQPISSYSSNADAALPARLTLRAGPQAAA